MRMSGEVLNLEAIWINGVKICPHCHQFFCYDMERVVDEIYRKLYGEE